MFTRKPASVSSMSFGPVGMQVEYTPAWLPACCVICFMPALKHESPMPCATTMGRLAAGLMGATEGA